MKPVVECKKILGFDVINIPFEDLLRSVFASGGRRVVVNTISPNSFGLASVDGEFRSSLKGSILVLDGVYFSLASILRGGGSVHRNQGPQITRTTLEYANGAGMKVFFLGSTEATLKGIAERMQRCYPAVECGYYSPPFREVFAGEENEEMCARVNAFGPDVLLIGMTCPKQEKWIHANRDRLDFKLSISVGAVFDWLAGNYREIGEIWWRLRLGWLVRAIQRPSLIRRNVPNYWIFFKHMVRNIDV